MRIGIDVDNVITDTVNGVLDYVNARLPLKLTIDDIKEYWMEAALPEQYRWVIQMAFEDPSMWKNVKMIDGAAKYIGQLYEDGHEIYFVTATTPNNFKKKIGFLSRELPFSEKYVHEHSISIRKKQLLDIDYLIDDCLDNLIGERLYKSICFDYPWNRDYTYDDGIDFFRAKNWEEIYEIIKLNQGNQRKGGAG